MHLHDEPCLLHTALSFICVMTQLSEKYFNITKVSHSKCPMHIIELVDSISRDGPDTPYVKPKYIKEVKLVKFLT